VFWDNSYSARVFGSTFKDIREFPWFSGSASFDQEADFFCPLANQPCLLPQSPIDVSHQALHDRAQISAKKQDETSETYPTMDELFFSDLAP
jgi:hypothetical protein